MSSVFALFFQVWGFRGPKLNDRTFSSGLNHKNGKLCREMEALGPHIIQSSKVLSRSGGQGKRRPKTYLPYWSANNMSMSKIQNSWVTTRNKKTVKTNVQLKIYVWRCAHSVKAWIGSPGWKPNTVFEKAENTIKICNCIYTWSIMTHDVQASKVFKLMKGCWLFPK